jgi:hypothetical protein
MALSNPSHPNHHLSTLSSTGSNFSSLDPYLEDSNIALPRSSISDPPARTSSGESVNRQATTYKHRQSAQSISSSRANRSGLFTLAALARGKTSSAIANLSDPILRSRISSGSLPRQSTIPCSGETPHSPSEGESITGQEDSKNQSERAEAQRGSNSNFSQLSTLRPQTSEPSPHRRRKSLLDTNPPSQSYESTEADTPSPTTVVQQGNYNKMHQTSSRLLRMTDDERPFTRVSVNTAPAMGVMLNICIRISRISLRLSLSAYRLPCTE